MSNRVGAVSPALALVDGCEPEETGAEPTAPLKHDIVATIRARAERIQLAADRVNRAVHVIGEAAVAVGGSEIAAVGNVCQAFDESIDGQLGLLEAHLGRLETVIAYFGI